jgi:hypothetical protein
MVAVQFAEPVHYPDIVSLIQQDEPDFTLSVFHKKYLTSDQNLKIIAVKNEKIVGFIGGLADTQSHNEVMYWAVDAVVDIHHRKQGIITLLLKNLMDYGKQVIGIGVKNDYILKAEINAGFKISTHLRTFTAYPYSFAKNTLKKITDFNTSEMYQNKQYFEVLLDTLTQTVAVIKKEQEYIRVMECSNRQHYLSIVPKIARFYGQKARFLLNTRHYSMLQTCIQTCAIPAKKPEILIYTHEYMRELPVYFGHSDWFKTYE